MAKSTQQNAKEDSGRLSRADWLSAALAMLVESGVTAVRVEPLALRLGVTKGSFYWHFRDRAALLSALLDWWEAECTAKLIEEISDVPSPAVRLRTLARLALSETWQGIDNARAEMAMQAWAAQDAAVAVRLSQIDSARTDYLHSLLSELGFAEERATLLATAIYQGLIGVYAARAYNPQLASYQAFMALVELILAETRWNR